jgi:hypothetical protein
LLRALHAPALATLIARANRPSQRTFDGFARTLPHEHWLAQQLQQFDGVRDPSQPLALAHAAMCKLGLPQQPGYWLILNPVHVHIARDHLILTDQRQLHLSDAQSLSLFAAAEPYFAEVGKQLLFGDAKHWFMRADDWCTLLTATPDAACGHNIDIWMPQGERARDWRKLQNEVQMLWHAHPVNEERADQGQAVVNSLWMWGGEGGYDDSAVVPSGAQPKNKVQAVFNCSVPLAGLAQAGGVAMRQCDAPTLLQCAPERSLLVLDQLVAAALAGDWSDWLIQMQYLERDWFAPLLAAHHQGKLARIGLILSHASAYRCFTAGRSSRYKFWVKPGLTRLASKTSAN